MPSWVITAFLVVGVVGLLAALFIGKIPFVNQYHLPIKIVSIVVFVTGVYLQGALGYKTVTANEVAALKDKLAHAEQEATNTNNQINTRIVTQQKVIHEKGDTVVQYIDREVTKYDSSCKLPPEAIAAHNTAASMDVSKISKGAAK